MSGEPEVQVLLAGRGQGELLLIEPVQEVDRGTDVLAIVSVLVQLRRVVAFDVQAQPAHVLNADGARRARLLLPTAGAVAGPVAGLAELGRAFTNATAAVRVAQPGSVVRADRMGPAQLLAALPSS
ncbi:hypothetical protein [Streptomyces jeddahensis]|uniref:hypothetical protein n=1 Tax=Streptomyces jeddahensis TaxID=1716141 RepID=UPI0012FF5B1A|nr:hypothetical protein [Streptomyces jeddahensis]